MGRDFAFGLTSSYVLYANTDEEKFAYDRDFFKKGIYGAFVEINFL